MAGGAAGAAARRAPPCDTTREDHPAAYDTSLSSQLKCSAGFCIWHFVTRTPQQGLTQTAPPFIHALSHRV